LLLFLVVIDSGNQRTYNNRAQNGETIDHLKEHVITTFDDGDEKVHNSTSNQDLHDEIIQGLPDNVHKGLGFSLLQGVAAEGSDTFLHLVWIETRHLSLETLENVGLTIAIGGGIVQHLDLLVLVPVLTGGNNFGQELQTHTIALLLGRGSVDEILFQFSIFSNLWLGISGLILRRLVNWWGPFLRSNSLVRVLALVIGSVLITRGWLVSHF